MPFPLLIPLAIYGGAQLAKAGVDAYSANQASKQQQAGAKEARGLIEGYYKQGTGYQQPYYQAGQEALGTMSDMMRNGAFNVDPMSYQAPTEETTNFNFESDPSYKWRMNEGISSIENSAAAKGMQLSTATLKNLQKYGQGMASQEYANAYSRFADTRDFLRNKYTGDRAFGYNSALNSYNQAADRANASYGRWGNMVNMGQSAANNLSNMATNAGSQVADTAIMGANARAAGTMGVGNAVGGAIGNLGQMGMYASMNNMIPAQGGAPVQGMIPTTTQPAGPNSDNWYTEYPNYS
jgi:hypothetical protein